MVRRLRLFHPLPEYQMPSRPVHIVYHQDRYRPPKLRSFVDFLMQTIGREI